MFIPLVVAASYLFGPIVLLLPLWRARTNRWQSRLELLTAVAFSVSLFLIGRWDLVGYWFRYALIGLLTLSVLRWLRVQKRDPPAAARVDASVVLLGVLFAFFAGSAVLVLLARIAPAESVPLRFPLAGGIYYVAHGGAGIVVNNHHSVRSQQFALDIVELGPLGYRASGLMPRELASYAIYGRTVLSPCDGTVLEAVGFLPDLPIGERDASRPAGNHVVIGCRGVRVELAHMQQGSVRVAAGEAVSTGAPLGLVGNSGNTSEPHLHVHAVSESGEGVPVMFEGRFLIRNDRWLQAGDLH